MNVIYCKFCIACAGAYSLSMLDIDQNRVRAVKHYRVRDLDDGGCYITTKKRCASMEELVKYYSGAEFSILNVFERLCLKMKVMLI